VGDRPRDQPQAAGEPQPAVPGQQAPGGEAGQSGGAQEPARHVVHEEPPDEDEEGGAEHQGARQGPHQGGDDPDGHGRDAGQEGRFGGRGEGGDAGEFQALPGDGQHEEGDQPRQQARHVQAAQPQQGPAQRADGARGLGEQGRARLPAPEAHAQRGQRGASGDEQQPGQGRVGGREQQQAARAEQGGGRVGPPAAQGDGAFQRHQGAGEAEDEQDAVDPRQPLAGDRGGQSEQDQGGVETGEQADPGGQQQRHPAGPGAPGRAVGSPAREPAGGGAGDSVVGGTGGRCHRGSPGAWGASGSPGAEAPPGAVEPRGAVEP